MQNKKKKKRRQLRTWVKVVLVLLVVLIIGGLTFPLLKSQDPSSHSQKDQKETETSTETRAVVMIDPGHGGMDGGAISTTGKTEKEFALEYALKIGEYIREIDPSIKVIYTRLNDEIPWVDPYTSYNYEYDDLVGRANVVNEQAPNYLLSVHFNSREDENEYGYEGYVRSDDQASDTIYSYIAKNLEEVGYSKDRGCWSTEAYPLHMVDMTTPASLLIELGFMTNKNDVAELNNSAEADRICKAIAQAYCKYIEENPNPAPHEVKDPNQPENNDSQPQNQATT